MVQKGTAVQCQPLSGWDIRRWQRHSRQLSIQQPTEYSNAQYATVRSKQLLPKLTVQVSLKSQDGPQFVTTKGYSSHNTIYSQIILFQSDTAKQLLMRQEISPSANSASFLKCPRW
ncbi:hypothetical protein NL108_001763 [Boleophthalmus pectinirostris]|nr:hypothetical protein NL108_001763 [Boleophthalmus pectinirostris]